MKLKKFGGTIWTFTYIAVVIAVMARFLSVTLSEKSKPRVARAIPEWHELLKGRQPFLGHEGAPVAVIEFSDYQCPFCRLLEPRLVNLFKEHPVQIAMYRYEYPLDTIHPYARAAAYSAYCAGVQNVAESYQSELFKAKSLEDPDWTELAKTADVRDLEAFRRCTDKHDGEGSVDKDVATGNALKISSTPTLIINGTMISGALSDKELEKYFRDAIRK